MPVLQNSQPLWHRVRNTSPIFLWITKLISPRESGLLGESDERCPSVAILFSGDSEECEVVSLCSVKEPDFDGNPDAAILVCLDPLSHADLVIGVGRNWVTQNYRGDIADGSYTITVERAHPPSAGGQFVFKFTLTASGSRVNQKLTLSNVSVTRAQ